VLNCSGEVCYHYLGVTTASHCDRADELGYDEVALLAQWCSREEERTMVVGSYGDGLQTALLPSFWSQLADTCASSDPPPFSHSVDATCLDAVRLSQSAISTAVMSKVHTGIDGVDPCVLAATIEAFDQLDSFLRVWFATELGWVPNGVRELVSSKAEELMELWAWAVERRECVELAVVLAGTWGRCVSELCETCEALV
jgi:hypothetical protein